MAVRSTVTKPSALATTVSTAPSNVSSRVNVANIRSINASVGQPHLPQVAKVGLSDIDSLSDVIATNPSDGDLLIYNESTDTWRAGRINGGEF